MLRCIASGVYDKIPGDGREFSVTVRDAVTVRAEDGRYVNNCNVGAFISNLPTPPGVDTTIDTSKFCTREASGSTSQASNVSEAIEMGASAMLVDEDVSGELITVNLRARISSAIVFFPNIFSRWLQCLVGQLLTCSCQLYGARWTDAILGNG